MLKNRLVFAAAILLTCSAFAASASDGVTANEILIGQTVGLTGTVADPVKEMNEGANAYFSMVNKSGGVNGRKITLLTIDDKFDPAQTVVNTESLISDHHVFALFQGRGTPHTQAILPILAAHQVPLIAPSTGALIFREPVNHLVFNIRASYQDEIAKEVEEFSVMGFKRIALLHVDDAFGMDGLAAFKKSMAAFQLSPSIITTFARVHPDYATTAATIIDANPQALIIVSSSKNTIEVIEALRAAGSRMQIMTLSNNSSESFVKELGASGRGVVVSQVAPTPNLTSKLGHEFVLSAKATGIAVSYAAIEGFVNAKVLVEGLRRAGSNPTREGLVHALETMDHFDLGGMTITYDQNNHVGSKFVELTIISKDGHFLH